MLNAFMNKVVGDARLPLEQRILHVHTLMTAVGCLVLFIIDGIRLETTDIRFPIIESVVGTGAFCFLFVPINSYVLAFCAVLPTHLFY
jgi:hypothetical protein